MTNNHPCKIFLSIIERALEDKDFPSGAVRLLLWIKKNVDWSNLGFSMNYKAVSRDLRISKVTYYRWREALMRKGIINRDKKYKEMYYLNL